MDISNTMAGALACAVLGTLLVGSLFDWGRRALRRADVESRRRAAEAFLRSQGMEVYAYLPSMGHESGLLRDALAVFDHTDRLVLDKHGALVGRVLPKVVVPETRGIRLVVDNTRD